ncbi:MAG TPA: hypothetical protein VMD92_03335 [Acidobacteriaceae bacterium]|nr:hypothetical protein [Acidobacteriaceae bacterium]
MTLCYTDAALPAILIMRCRASLSALLVLATVGVPARADVAAIHRDRLPQTAPVLAAFDDARAMEPYTDRWSDKWRFPIARADAVSHLTADFAALQAAVKDNPSSEELLLLAGLVAHYGYNVDVEHTDDAVVSDLEAAGKLDSRDFRVPWFHADFMCQTIKPSVGAKEFLAIEAAHPWRELPPAFWRNYEHCAAVTNMPTHLLRAAGYLAQLTPATSDDQFYANIGHSRLEAVNLKKDYDAESSWIGGREGDDITLTSTACGVAFHAKAAWGPERLELESGSCVAIFSTGPYLAPGGPLHPQILVMVQQPKGSETLADYARRFTKKGTFTATTAVHCPVTDCLALQGAQRGVYGKDGDSHPRLVFFERDEPANPGLLLEMPQDPPAQGQGLEYLRPNRMLQRIPGKLYYLVTVDTAASIEAGAYDDLDYFLAHLQVE